MLRSLMSKQMAGLGGRLSSPLSRASKSVDAECALGSGSRFLNTEKPLLSLGLHYGIAVTSKSPSES